MALEGVSFRSFAVPLDEEERKEDSGSLIPMALGAAALYAAFKLTNVLMEGITNAAIPLAVLLVPDSLLPSGSKGFSGLLAANLVGINLSNYLAAARADACASFWSSFFTDYEKNPHCEKMTGAYYASLGLAGLSVASFISLAAYKILKRKN